MLQIGDKQHFDDLHIYLNVIGTLMSWKTCRELWILSDCYPNPTITSTTVRSVANTIATPQTLVCLLISTRWFRSSRLFLMITSTAWNVKNSTFILLMTLNPSPRSIPYAYRDKLKAELDLLESQNIITPVTEVTNWCVPIVVAPKKNSDRIRMCVGLSHLNRFVKRERY